MRSLIKNRYADESSFNWDFPSNVFTQGVPLSDPDKICESCESVKDDDIKKLKSENVKLKSLVEFLRKEMQSLEQKTAMHAKAVPLKTIVREFTSTPDGKKAWDLAWEEQYVEWEQQVNNGEISRVKYYRLINIMDQATLAKKLKTTKPYISRIEKVGYNIPISTLKRLANIFKVKKEILI